MKLSAEDVLPEGDATLDDGTMPPECAVLEKEAIPEDEGFRTKLAEVFVKNPVDGAVPVTCVPLFRP